MIPTELFQRHIDLVASYTTEALTISAQNGAPFDGILFHAGSAMNYHADDHPVNFHTVPHFARFAPVQGPDHVIHFKPGETPTLYWVVPEGYWYEAPPALDHPYLDVLDVVQVGTPDAILADLPDVSNYAYIGNKPGFFANAGVKATAEEPKTLLAALDWFRATKTEYEILCVRAAVHKAAKGYAAVAALVDGKPSERELHAAYLAGSGQLELETPYGNIIGWDDHAAILHYQSQSVDTPKLGHTFLIDAGTAVFGYASDMTRTYFTGNPHPVFTEIRKRIDRLTLDGVARCIDGGSYVDLHDFAHREVASILTDTGISNLDAEQTYEKGYTRLFFPHGLGHHLGLQVHDVGGHQVDPTGTIQQPDERYPFLRTTRPMATGHVLTVEPGFYFIPMLLNEKRSSSDLNWILIDELTPLGGVRIEDDVVVTDAGPDNLSREPIPQPL